MQTYWQKQDPDKPLFPDILWSRPESKHSSGKLAVIGGNAHAMGAPGIAWNTALEAGIGVCNVLLPHSVKHMVKHVLPDADFSPSNPSGSFAKKSLDQFLSISSWADATLIAGDMGRNSETAILLESYVQKYSGPLVITHDAADYFKAYPKLLLERPETLVVVSIEQLQKIFINAPLMIPITYGMTLPNLAEALHELTKTFPVCIAVKHHDTVFVAYGGDVVSTKHEPTTWRIEVAAKAAVYWLQNPSQILAAVASSLVTDTRE